MFNVSRDVPIIKDIKGRAAVLSLLTFFAISMLGFSLPVFAHDIPTPYCSTTGSYQVCTDQEDYSPAFTAHIAGSGFTSDSSYLIKVTRPDGSVVTGDGSFGTWPADYDTVVADSNGNFQFDYILDGILGTYNIEVLDLENNVLAIHSFTDDVVYGKIIVTKSVVNDNGGTKTASDFTITATGTCDPSPLSFSGSSTGTTVTCTTPGSRTLIISESPVTGYTTTFSSGCSGTIGNGETKTCIVTNDDNPIQVCGNGHVEGTEACDNGNTNNGDCCSSTCQYESSSTVCRASADVCDIAEYCSGSSATCPSDSFKPNTFECRASAGVCDLAETCTGTGVLCPTDLKSTAQCRASAGQCDVAESCDGVSNDCPVNAFKAAGISCDDGLFCNIGETCNGAGACTDGSARSCSANNIFDIATCLNDPDAKSFTWDYRAAFTSTCDEDANICTTGSETITHTCNKATCGAECDQNSDCTPELSGDSCEYGGTCNTNPASCSCNYASSQYCPTPGTINDGTCYYGTQSCTGSGCGLSTEAMGNYDTCDPSLGPIDKIPPVIASHGDETAEATSASGAIVTYTSPAIHDAVDGDGTATCLPASGSTFPLGDTTVTCNAEDAAGNHAIPTTFKVTVQDTTPPTVSISGAPSDWINTDQTATVTCSDTGSGCDSASYKIEIFSSNPVTCPTDYLSYTSTSPQTISSHSWVCGAAKDNVNNVGYSSPVEFKVDEISPTISDDYSNDNVWINTATGTITLSPADTGDSGLKADPNAVKYCTGSGCDPSTGTTLSSPYQLSFSAEQNTIVRYQSYDNAGSSSTVGEFIVKIDLAAPTTSDDYTDTNWYSTDRSITLTPADTGGSGIQWTKYCESSGCDPTTGISYSGTVTYTTTGDHIFRYASKDNAGNVQTTVEKHIKIDKTAPSGGSITYTDGYYTTASVPITYSTGTDSDSGLDTASGKIQRASVTLSGGVCGSFGSFTDLVTEFDGSYTDTSVASGNCYKYQYVIADNVGNSATYTSDNIAKVDTDAPTTSDDASATWRSTDATVTLTPSDTGGSGVVNTYYCIYNSEDAACTPTTTGTSVSVTCAADSVCEQIVRYYSTDNAGNSETAHDSAIIQIDKTKPETTLTIGTPKSGSDPTYVSLATGFTLSATDTGSDVDYIEYHFDSDDWTTYSSAFTAPSLGSHTLYYRSVDNAGNVEVEKSEDITVVVFTVLKLLKVSIPSGTTPGQYSDPATVSAKLTDLDTGLPISGKTITFTIGTQTATATTGLDGVASTSIILDQPSGSYTVSASFTATGYFDSSDSKTFTINKENVAIAYTGDTFKVTEGASSMNILLSAQLTQEADGHFGDITKAKVTFVLTPEGGGTSYTFGDIGVNSAGVASITRNIVTGVYSIEVKISDGNQYWIQNPEGVGTLVVTTSTSSSVTGGGWITDTQSRNNKGNFGFELQYNKNLAPKGNFVYVWRGTDGFDYKVKSTSWQKGAVGLAFTSSSTAIFSGNCVIQKINPVTGETVESWGNSKLTVQIEDKDMKLPQTGIDRISISFVASGSGGPSRTISMTNIGNGNIVVHSK